MESGRDGEVGGEGQPNLFYIQSCTSSVSSTVGCNHKIDYAVIFLHFKLGPSCWLLVCRKCIEFLQGLVRQISIYLMVRCLKVHLETR